MNLCFIDIETTGLDPQQNEIIEIGAVHVNDDVICGEFEVKIHPLHIQNADPESLKVNGYKKEDWNDAFVLRNALLLLNHFIGNTKPHFIAYDVSFDWGFIQKAYSDCNIKHPFDRKFDLLTLAWAYRPVIDRLSLKNVCGIFNLPPEPDVHRAINGVRCAREVYEKLKVTIPIL